MPVICNDCITTFDEAYKNRDFMHLPKHMAKLSALTKRASELPVACDLCAYICHHIYQEAAVPNEDLRVQLHVVRDPTHLSFHANLGIEFDGVSFPERPRVVEDQAARIAF